jgi:hypothetical protein
VNRGLRAGALAAVVALLGLAVHGDFPLCPMASSFGVPCPGCGLTRATLALLRGDFAEALHFHPLVWLLTPLFVTFVGVAVLEFVGLRPRVSPIRWQGRGTNIASVLVLLLTFGVWLLRFAGYFGGPAPVTTLYQWLATR